MFKNSFLVNSLKLTAGLLAFDSGKPWQILSRFTWELPQTVLGYTTASLHNFAGAVAGGFGLSRDNSVRVGFRNGATVTYGNSWIFKGGNAITLSSYISGGDELRPSIYNALFMHEYGHYLQSLSSGPLFLSKFGVPSLLSAGGTRDHNYHPVEQDANAKAIKYFGKRYNSAEKGYDHIKVYWDFRKFPVSDYREGESYDSPHNKWALKNANIGSYGFTDVFNGFLGIIPPFVSSWFASGSYYHNKYSQMYNDNPTVESQSSISQIIK